VQETFHHHQTPSKLNREYRAPSLLFHFADGYFTGIDQIVNAMGIGNATLYNQY
jgi:hypothetical protein